MKDFILAALPWGAVGIAIAVACVSSAKKKDSEDSEEKRGASLTNGVCYGLCFGVAIGTALDNMGLGIALGMALGLLFGAVFPGKGKS